MKQVIIGLALVAVGMCTVTSTNTRSAADEYYNKGSNVEMAGMGGSLTGVGKKFGGATQHKKLDREVNPIASTREEDELAYNIKIDQGEIENIIEDFEDFGERYWKKTGRERTVLMKKLNDAYRNFAAKMILNFGKTIPPVVQAWSEVMRHVQVNPKCD